MIRRPFWPALAAALCLASAAAAQPVEVSVLAPPDLFSPGARDTGLGGELWRGASAATARKVIPRLARDPLSPAAEALARRILATGAAGPQGAGEDADLAAARIEALLALGDATGAESILARTANVERAPALAQAAAESALLAGDDDRACQIGEGLAAERDGAYWLRLRAYCRLRSGDLGAARLTFELAQDQARDAIYGRLMGARLNGGDPGAAALRNGLDYALSRSLGLDLSQAKPTPMVAAALSGLRPQRPVWSIAPGPSLADAATALLAQGDLAGAEGVRAGMVQDEIPGVSASDLALLDAMLAVASGRADGPNLDRLVERGGVGDARTRERAQAAAMLVAALGAPMSAAAQGEFAAFPVDHGKAPPARLFALELAAERRFVGETAMLALWISADAGVDGPAAVDRARIVRALKTAGLEADARNYALEGLLELR